MIDAIVYTSKCGHTLTYAKALALELQVPYYTIKEAKKNLKKGSNIIYMSWIKEDKIMNYDKALRYHIDLVITTGILPVKDDTTYRIKEYNQLYSQLICLPGGIKKRRLSFLQRISLKSIENHLSFKLLDHGLKKEEIMALDAILHDLSYINLDTLKPIIDLYKPKDENLVS